VRLPCLPSILSFLLQQLAVSILAGLQKMSEAKADVNTMQSELEVMYSELAVAAKEAEAVLKLISEGSSG